MESFCGMAVLFPAARRGGKLLADMSKEDWARVRLKQVFGYLRADVEALAIDKTLSLLERCSETDFTDALISDLVTSARIVIAQWSERAREIVERRALVEEENFERQSKKPGYWQYPRLSPEPRTPSWILPTTAPAATVGAGREGSEQMLECRMCHKPLGAGRKGKQFCCKEHQKRYWYLHRVVQAM